jgi:hypothetical protein
MPVEDKPGNQRYSASKSGIMPRPVLEPEGRREPPQPSTLPEMREEDSATTGAFPVVSEGHDSSAVGDVDKVRGS